MKRIAAPTRRGLIAAGATAIGGLVLSGCDRLTNAPEFRSLLDSAEGLTYRAQRLLLGQRLAPEFQPRDISPTFRTNGTDMPPSPAYQALAQVGFSSWRLA